MEDDEKGVDEDEEGGEGRGGIEGGEGLEEEVLLIKGGRVANDVDNEWVDVWRAGIDDDNEDDDDDDDNNKEDAGGVCVRS